MENSRKWLQTMEVILAAMLIIMACAVLWEKGRNNLHKVSVIIQNSDGHQWSAFRYGLKMAAQDQEIEIVIASTGDVLTVEEELDTIRREIDHGADAVIVQPVPGADLEKKLKKLEKKVPIMLVECTAAKEQEKSLFPVVEPDHDAMGRALAEELLKDYNGNLSGKTVGIVTESDETESVRNRIKGFEEILKDTGAECSWTISDCSAETGENSLEAKPEVDLVIALDDHSLITTAEYAAANNLHGALVYGIGNSTEAVYYLDTGTVECLVVPDEFSAGYQSLTEAAESLEHFFRKMKSRTVSHTVIRREELFTRENQEILFTMSQ